MGTPFGRWLGRPSSLHFLRQLVAPEDAYYRAGAYGDWVGRRWVATVTAETQDENEREDGRKAVHQQARSRPSSAFVFKWMNEPGLASESDDTKSLDLKRAKHLSETNVRSVLGFNSREYGIHMSFRAGVPMVDRQIGPDDAFGELRHQADVGNVQKKGKLLVDQAEHRTNFDLWLELLRFRQRLDGSKGALEVWHGMRERDADLPVEGATSGVFWSATIQAILDQDQKSRHSWLKILVSQASLVKASTGKYYAGLYKEIVGFHWRQGLGSKAHHWHLNLEKAGLVPKHALKSIIRDCVRGFDKSWRSAAFKRIYKTHGQRDLYDTCIKACLDLGKQQDAQHWHSWLLKQGDYPSQEMSQTSEVQRLFSLDRNKSLPVRNSLTRKTSESRAKDVPEQLALTRASMSTIIGDVHGIKPKEISDSFVARMFATRAFSLDIIIRGLNFFSVDRIGPVALREMALRAGTPFNFSTKLRLLQQMKVKVSSAMYCRIAQKLADEGQNELFAALLTSDQHPDAYDDTATQDALLATFLREGSWAQAHITLLGLTLAGGSGYHGASNRMLQHHIYTRQWHSVETLMQTMQSQRAPMMPVTISSLLRLVLPERRVRRRPVERQRHEKPHFDPLDFVTNALMYAEREQPGTVRATAWIELLKRYGMSYHRWSSLEALVLWLAERYKMSRDSMRNFLQSEKVSSMSPRLRWVARRRRVLALQRTRPFYLIFDINRQHAIFGWAFRTAGIRKSMQFRSCEPQHMHPLASDALADDDCTPGAKPVDPWARGLVLLRRLQMDYGIPIDKSHLRQVITMRLWIMFGPAYSNLRINEAIRQNNEIPLGRYIQHINEVWSTPEPLFGDIPGGLIRSAASGRDPEADADLVVRLFGSNNGGLRKTGEYKHVQEYVDVLKWARHVAALRMGLGTGATNGRKNTAYQRQRAWEQSPFRVVRPKLGPSPYAPGAAKWSSDLDCMKWKGARVPAGPQARYVDVRRLASRAKDVPESAVPHARDMSASAVPPGSQLGSDDLRKADKEMMVESLQSTQEQAQPEQEQHEQEDDVVQYLPLGIALKSNWYQEKS